MKTSYLLLTVFFAFCGINSNANDTLIKFAQPLATAPTWNYKGGGTNLDAVAWKVAGYAEPSWLLNRAAPLGFGTLPTNPVTLARNTLIPLDNTAGGGGSPNRYPTLYFRKAVNIANPAIYSNFQIRAKFDDAIVVWVNGVEAFRSNITAAPAYATLATANITNEQAEVYTGIVPTSLFVAGNNIIAVEIHQSSLTSGDLYFDMELTGLNTVNVIRGPILQMGGQTGITIRWRTDEPTNSRVTYGTTHGTYTNTVDDATVTTEHIVNLSGLTPDTKYYYTIGSTTTTLQNDVLCNFLTLPPANTTRKLRFVAFGDCGDGSANQVAVKNAFRTYMGSNDVDAMLLLGDNTYNWGLNNEFQTYFFDPYKNDILKYYKLYPAPGNHDYGENNTLPVTGNRNNPYFQSFTVPTAGELGGVPSGTESFYSYDIGDVHFLSLDSYGTESGSFATKMYDTTSPQTLWVKADLAANTKRWTIAYWHHAPYTKIGLNSDSDAELIAIRERFIRILERYGVDLVVCGHSHGHERSYLLKNYYKATSADPNMLDVNFRKNLHTADSSSALYNNVTANSCAYTYNSGQYNHGTVYVVSGSAGRFGHGTTSGYPHDAMAYSSNAFGGVFYIEVDSNKLVGRYITQSASLPVVRDSFFIFKDVKKFTSYTVAPNSVLNIQSSWKGTYNWYAGGTTSPNLSTNRSFNVPTNTPGIYRYVVKDFSNNTCLKDSFEVVVSGTLPVSLTSFTATLNNSRVILKWATSAEQNNKYFTIERSTDGINFIFLARVNGAGNSNNLINYQAVDYTPVDGINYYRLSQTNIDDRTAYFDIKAITYKSKYSFTSSFANQTNGIKVSINSSKNDNIRLRIVDFTGREVTKDMFYISTGTLVKNYSLAKGTYIIQLSNSNKETINTKIIIK
jgi:Calcineurin-like phosphoesterase/Purple acid Phosphatase, N-terminal domain